MYKQWQNFWKIDNKFKNVKKFLNLYNIKILVVFWIIITFIFAVIGYSKLFEMYSLKENYSTYFYNAIRIFGLYVQLPNIDSQLPWQLEVARWLAAVGATYFILKAVLYFFKIENRLLLIKNHIIMIGAGNVAKHLFLDWKKQYKNLKVVVIEKDKENLNLNLFKNEGCLIITGDASDDYFLQKAKVHKAQHICILTDDDVTNINVISKIIDIEKKSFNNNKSKKYIHISDDEYLEIFMLDKFKKHNIKIFNIYQNMARIVFNKDNILGYKKISNLSDQEKRKIILNKTFQVKIAILGFETLGLNSLLYILNVGYFYNEIPIDITIVYDHDVDKNKNIKDEFIKHYDILENYSTYWNINFIDDGEFFKQPYMNYNHILFTFEEKENLSNLMKLIKKYSNNIIDNNIDIIVCSDTLQSIIQYNDEKISVFDYIRAFPSIEEVCKYENIIEDKLDKQAKLNNYYYQLARSDKTINIKDESKEIEKQWENINVFLKLSNRYAVEHNEIKNYIIDILTKTSDIKNDSIILDIIEDLKKISFNNILPIEKLYKYLEQTNKLELVNQKISPLTKEQFVQLAKIEHKRWNAFHLLRGWKVKEIEDGVAFEDRKDEYKKLHSCLVKWNELDEVSKKLKTNFKSGDFESILRIPLIEGV